MTNKLYSQLYLIKGFLQFYPYPKGIIGEIFVTFFRTGGKERRFKSYFGSFNQNVNQILFLFCIISMPFLVNGQVRKINEEGSGLINLERHQFKFDLLAPGLSYEFGLFRNQSVSTSLGLGLATYQEGYAYGLAWNNRYRYYHNFTRRIGKGKNVSGNSGNYVAAAQAIFFSQLRIGTNIKGPKDFNLGFYGLLYGIQRTYPKGFNFTAELGAGYYKGDGVLSGYGPFFSFNIGWVATKRKSRKPVFD